MLQVWHITSEPLDRNTDLNDGEEEAGQDIITNLLTSPSSTTPAHKECVQLSYIIAFATRGALSKVAWLPNEFLPAPAHTSALVWEQLLGVVAVVCSDGTCLVLLLPKASAVTLPSRTTASSSTTTRGGSGIDRRSSGVGVDGIGKIPVLLEASVCKWEVIF